MNPSHLIRRQLLVALGCTLAAFASSNASAQTWPSKPLRMIVGYPAGSSPDMQARLLAEPPAFFELQSQVRQCDLAHPLSARQPALMPLFHSFSSSSGDKP